MSADAQGPETGGQGPEESHPAGSRRFRGRRVRYFVIVLALAGSVWAGFNAGTSLVVSRDIGEPDAIVMLASHEWERLPASAAVARQYPVSRVILTVPIKVTKFNCSECPERPAQLQAQGIAADRIVELTGDPAANTYGEATSVRRYVEGHPLRKLLVVTSPYHTRRAIRVFAHVFGPLGVDVGVLPATQFSPANPRRWWLGVYDRGYVPYEWAGIFYYRIKYGVPLN